MGTRSLTKFYEEGDDKPFAVMYRQFDGYPEGHGQELAEYLAGRRRVNGFTPNDTAQVAANGIGCLAAQVVHYFKTEGKSTGSPGAVGPMIGGIYLQPEVAPGDAGEEYIYEVRPDAGAGWRLTVKGVRSRTGAVVLFEGAPQDFNAAKCNKRQEELM